MGPHEEAGPGSLTEQRAERPGPGGGHPGLINGDLTAAAALFERVRDLIARTRGPTHLDSGAVIGNIAEIIPRQSALVESQQTSEEALEILSGALGPDHAGLAEVHWGLARSLALQGQPAPGGERRV